MLCLLRLVKSDLLIVNIDLLCVPFAAVSRDNHYFGGKKDRIMYCAKKVALSVRTPARTDWLLSLAEPLLIISINQSIRHGRL